MATKKKRTKESSQAAKNPWAVALGRLGGLKGGKARAEKLSAKERLQISRLATKALQEKIRARKNKLANP